MECIKRGEEGKKRGEHKGRAGHMERTEWKRMKKKKKEGKEGKERGIEDLRFVYRFALVLTLKYNVATDLPNSH